MPAVIHDPELNDASIGGTGRWMTVIHNNEANSMEEVVMILIIATGCDADEAYMEMWEAHTYGKAPCHFGTQSECEDVAATISRIGVETEVMPEWDDA